MFCMRRETIIILQPKTTLLHYLHSHFVSSRSIVFEWICTHVSDTFFTLNILIIVFDGQAVPQGSNSLLVSWTLNSECQGPHFEITYGLIRHEACPDDNADDSYTQLVMTNATSKELSGLEGFATYNISISVAGHYSSKLILSGTTSPGRKFTIWIISEYTQWKRLCFVWLIMSTVYKSIIKSCRRSKALCCWNNDEQLIT